MGAAGWCRPATALLLAVVLASAGAPAAAGAAAAGDCPGCGGVAGSVTVQQATFRTEGPKHDRDVVLYLDRVEGAEPPPPARARASMDQKGLVFIPHVLAVQRGTTVTFLNSDNDQHNVYFLNDRTGETLDIGTYGPGVSVDHTFDEAGTVITLCKLHLEMAAYVVVVDGPWLTVAQLDPSTSSAHFEIRGVPPGEYQLTAWHKKLRQKGGTARVSVPPDGTARVEVVITQGKYAKGSG